MKNLAFIITILFSQGLMAQGNTISGRVIDQKSGHPLEYATVSVFTTIDSSLVNGTISDEDGQFILGQLPDKSIFYEVHFLGYVTYSSPSFIPSNAQAVGDIALNLNSTNLEEVIVKGRAITSIHKLDKQVFDAAQFQNAKGGNASDVLANLPAVSINSFGEISVRGASGFSVMLNGKPIQGNPTLFLQQLSANTIEDIEIVTAPSAKYDPDGNAGIINIKTKQALADGQYFMANVLMGLPSIEAYDNANTTPRYGADFTFSRKQGKWDFSIGADYRRYDISGRREGYVNTYLGNILTEFPSDGERSFDEINYSARAGVRYEPNSRQVFNVGMYAGKRTKDRTADILYSNQQRSIIPFNDFLGTGQYFERYQSSGVVYPNGEVLNTLTYFNENLRVRRSDFLIGSLEYSHLFPDQSALSASALYERTILGGPTDNANLAFPNTQNILQLQNNDNDNPLDGYRVQLDYNKNLGATEWESGYQFRFLNHPGDFVYFDRDLQNELWIENPLFTNSIKLTRAIHSIYSQWSGKLQKLQYIAGLRLENFDRRVEIARPDSTYLLNRWNLFPSVNLGYDFKESWQLKAAYSRRIERTTTFKMTPFPEREHSETLEQGDAELLPEYIDLVELGVVKNWGDNSLFATAYFRRVNNVINRVNTVFNDSILNRIYTNVGVANALGLELGTTFFPTEKWRVHLGTNIFNYKIEGQLFDEKINTSNTIYSINANTNYDFSNSLSVQLAFNYLSKRVTAQGQDSDFYNPSLTLRKTFLDQKVSLSLQWRNIDLGLWSANEQRITTERSSFFTTTNYVYEVDIIQLSFGYQLNQPSKKVKLPDSEFGKKEF